MKPCLDYNSAESLIDSGGHKQQAGLCEHWLHIQLPGPIAKVAPQVFLRKLHRMPTFDGQKLALRESP